MLDPPEAESSIGMSGANSFYQSVSNTWESSPPEGIRFGGNSIKNKQIKYFVSVINLESRDANFVTLYHSIFFVLIFLRNKHTQGRIGIAVLVINLVHCSLSLSLSPTSL